MSKSTKDFPDWETLYKSQRVETMPWYNENFDSDLEKELDERKIINNHHKSLDLGTGPATQAKSSVIPNVVIPSSKSFVQIF